jgi:hypothetical protein
LIAIRCTTARRIFFDVIHALTSLISLIAWAELFFRAEDKLRPCNK